MKNLTTLALLCLFMSPVIAQVGINNVSPNASLDITASNQATPANNDGLLIPRIDAFPAANPAAAQHGMMVYLTTTDGGNPPGFYFWNNGTTNWDTISGAGADEINELNDGIYDGSSVFLGTGAGTNDDGGNFNTALGLASMTNVTSGFQNTAMGYFSLRLNATGQHNTGIGSLALYRTTSSFNTGLGSGSLSSNTSGTNNTAVGYQSLTGNSTGRQNTAVGVQSLNTNSVGFDNVAVGYQALLRNITRYNTAVGSRSLDANTTGLDNTAIGFNSLGGNIGGRGNIAVGSNALSRMTGASFNIAIGQSAMSGTTTSPAAQYNIGIGNNSVATLSTGSRNIGIGAYSLNRVTSGIGNVGIGDEALRNTNVAQNNTAIGYQAGLDNTGGGFNTYIGAQSGENGTVGRYNTFIGTDTGFNNVTGSNNIFIGYRAGYTETTSSKLYIDPSSTPTPLIYGDFSTDKLRVNGGLQVGDPSGTGYELPPVDGTSFGQTIITNGAGVTTWGTDDNQNFETFNLNPVTKEFTLALQDDGVVDYVADLSIITNTLEEAYNQGGVGAGRTIRADGGAVAITGRDGFEVSGLFGSGAGIALTGTGTRMFFNPRKGAFRAGSVISGPIYNPNAWDDTFVGNRSFAVNTGTVASGENSFASGQATNASGLSSTAMGYGTQATGFYEMAVGSYNSVATNRLFVVGNGPSSAGRSNALEVYNDGRVEINDAYTLPTADGTNGQVLTTDGAGTLSWENSGGSKTLIRSVMNATQTVPTSTTFIVAFLAEQYDTKNEFSGTTFTPTETGFYRVNVNLVDPGGSPGRFFALRNGTIEYLFNDQVSLELLRLSFSIQLNAGDTLQFQFENLSTINTNFIGSTDLRSFLEIEQID